MFPRIKHTRECVITHTDPRAEPQSERLKLTHVQPLRSEHELATRDKDFELCSDRRDWNSSPSTEDGGKILAREFDWELSQSTNSSEQPGVTAQCPCEPQLRRRG